VKKEHLDTPVVEERNAVPPHPVLLEVDADGIKRIKSKK
jgi:hypothetical protein